MCVCVCVHVCVMCVLYEYLLTVLNRVLPERKAHIKQRTASFVVCVVGILVIDSV